MCNFEDDCCEMMPHCTQIENSHLEWPPLCFMRKTEAPRPQDSSGSAEFNCSVTGFDVVDAQVKANNMTDILLDGTPQGLINLRGAITTAIMEAYKLGQQNK